MSLPVKIMTNSQLHVPTCKGVYTCAISGSTVYITMIMLAQTAFRFSSSTETYMYISC